MGVPTLVEVRNHLESKRSGLGQILFVHFSVMLHKAPQCAQSVVLPADPLLPG